MLNELNDFQKKFEEIKKMGWVKELRTSRGSCGSTFEVLLKKEEDDLPVPDYDNIEIKVMNDNTKTNLHLFNLIPDGDYLFPIKRILYELGCPSSKDRSKRVLYQTFNAVNYNKLVFGNKAKINVNYKERKVELIAFNHRQENKNIGISWSFDYLKERLMLKLQYLAFVRASSCIVFSVGYYYYHKVNYYKLKDFDTFIDLIDKGIIEITFKIGIHESGRRIGEVYDHGTDFSIRVSDLELLYDEIKLGSD